MQVLKSNKYMQHKYTLIKRLQDICIFFFADITQSNRRAWWAKYLIHCYDYLFQRYCEECKKEYRRFTPTLQSPLLG